MNVECRHCLCLVVLGVSSVTELSIAMLKTQCSIPNRKKKNEVKQYKCIVFID